MRLKRWLTGIAVVTLGLLGTLYWLTRPPENLTVVSWGDAYQQAQTVAFFHPFVDRTGINLDGAIYGGGLAEIRTQVEAGAVDWDVVDFDLAEAALACRKGLLESIDPASLPPGADGTPANDDFVAGAIGPCWVGTLVYSQVVMVAPGVFAEAPQAAADFFDVARFPGMRALRDGGPEFNLPFALLADGVAAVEVYRLLETEEGITRAFAKLDSISESILWWRRPNEAVDLITSGQAVMTTALNGRAFDAARADSAIGIIWDGQLYSLDVFGIPRGTPQLERAREFIAFATMTEPLAGMASRVPYGAARASAAATVGPNPMTGEEVRPLLPTSPENFGNALLNDPDWWADHGAPLRARWDTWRAGQRP
jgi:putative spermidine/putrescine transport system substrate-binding protein